MALPSYSYRFGALTGQNMTPRPVKDVQGLSATETVPASKACVFKTGRDGIGLAGFVTTDDPTDDPPDPLHFLITLKSDTWAITFEQWIEARAKIDNTKPETFPAPTKALLAISEKFSLEREAAWVGAIKSGPKIDRKDVRILWHCGYWDGPLSGIALYQGQKYWFRVIDRDAEPRAAALQSLTREQLQFEENRHTLFQQHVGTHTDYDSSGKRNVGALRPKSEWQKYYTTVPATAQQPTYEGNPIIGWFEL
jgi:hypothetical protein